MFSDRVLHIANRLSFGATLEQIEQINDRGIDVYIEKQLNPNAIEQSALVQSHVKGLDTLNMTVIEHFRRYDPAWHIKQKGRLLNDREQIELREQREILRKEAIQAHLVEAIFSTRQLQEVMVNFWFNHFNVHFAKSVVDSAMTDYVNSIRIHALGDFTDLLKTVARHPAMLLYLDNEVNTDPNSLGARGRFNGLNENYARELLELHTLGINGGYTQDDIVDLARIFTGWSLDRYGDRGNDKGFYFYRDRHDYNDKVFLGHTIKGNGMAEGEEALDILASHPSTARFISYKLARYFVTDLPPESLIEKLTAKFLDSQGNIREILKTLFYSSEFNDTQYYNQKFKTPFQYVVSLVRIAEINNPNFRLIKGMLGNLAMPVFGCSTPNGYPDTQEAWLNPDAILHRVSFASGIANGVLDRKNPPNISKISTILNKIISPKNKEIINSSSAKLKIALMLGSPEIMYR
jgi:uncharacterized protein (DUF1800 family)